MYVCLCRGLSTCVQVSTEVSSARSIPLELKEVDMGTGNQLRMSEEQCLLPTEMSPQPSSEITVDH